MSLFKRNGLRGRLPDRAKIFASRWTKPFAPLFDKPYFWTLNRRQAAVSVAVGMFCGLMPGPTQMLSALIVAYFLRTNLPVAVFSTLYTNPFTYMPLYYTGYKIGCLILGIEAADKPVFPKLGGGQFWSETAAWLADAGKPLLVGVPVLGCILAVAGYFAVLLLWRWPTVYHWRGRKAGSRLRSLTANEIEMAKTVFSDGIDYTRVRIRRGLPLMPNMKVAVSPNGCIYFPKQSCPADFALADRSYRIWLIHELTHVWQYQQGFRTWLGGLALALSGGYRKRRAYAYPPPEQITSFNDLNMEQQADLIAHYFAAKNLPGSRYCADLPKFQTALKDFLANPNQPSLLPKYRLFSKKAYAQQHRQ